MANNDVLFEKRHLLKGSIGIITLNRAKVLNALNPSMLRLLSDYLQQWEEDNHIKAVIIQSHNQVFCAGGDIRYLYEHGKENNPAVYDFFKEEYELNKLIFHYKKPYIAFLNGLTMGGGAGISLHGSIRIATSNLIFAMPETGIGFFPDVGGTYFLPRLPYKLGYFLGLTGARLTYQECFKFGLVDFCITPENFPLFLDALESNDTIGDPVFLKKMVEGYSYYPSDQSSIDVNELEDCFSEQTIETILKKLETGSAWAQDIAKLIKTKSPTSLKITLNALQKGETLSFDECIEMEYRLACQFLKGHDLYEGIRSVLIDKDHAPNWQPPALSDVTQNVIDSFFN